MGEEPVKAFTEKPLRSPGSVMDAGSVCLKKSLRFIRSGSLNVMLIGTRPGSLNAYTVFAGGFALLARPSDRSEQLYMHSRHCSSNNPGFGLSAMPVF